MNANNAKNNKNTVTQLATMLKSCIFHVPLIKASNIYASIIANMDAPICPALLMMF